MILEISKLPIARLLLGAVCAALIQGCAGTQSFSSAARAGDTVTLALGWNKPLTRGNTSVQISSGNTVYTFPPNDPSIRFLGQLYPDPAARLIVGRETNQALGVGAHDNAQQLEATVTGGDKDYAQTLLMFNLPATLPSGNATIRVLDASGTQVAPNMTVLVLPGTGAAQLFAGSGGGASSSLIANLERPADVKTVVFSASTSVPYAIQVDLLRTAGTGSPWLINPRGDLKALSWSDDGTRIRVLLTPANTTVPGHIMNFKFLVGGGLSGLSIDTITLKAVDSNGNVVNGVSASLL